MGGILGRTHADFGRLRLSQFLASGDVVPLNGWEYLGREWIGEATSGFTEWLCLESDPDVLRSIAVNLQRLPEPVVAAMLNAIQLPLRQGMTLDVITGLLGQPAGELNFVPDRTTYEFHVDGAAAYVLRCTVHRDNGLIYLTVHTTPLPE